MTKIDIVSGFLGAGKTTLMKQLIAKAYAGEQLVLIENEFGEIGIDGGFLKESGITVNEMNSGCICCSLVGDFTRALSEVLTTYHPDRILIEPSGVGKLSDVISAVKPILGDDVVLGACVAVADVTKCKLYLKNFGEFYQNQIESADTVFLSRTDIATEAKIAEAMALLRTLNAHAAIITTPWEQLDCAQLRATMEQQNRSADLFDAWKEEAVCPECGHIHADNDHDHDHDHECHAEHHHHHDHDHECHDEHHRHHDHDHECHDEHCHCHDHDHHHHADEVFTSIGAETAHRYTEAELTMALQALQDTECYGTVLRAKGIVMSADGRFLHFDYVPEESNIRYGSADITGRLCIIGSGLQEDALRTLFCIG